MEKYISLKYKLESEISSLEKTKHIYDEFDHKDDFFYLEYVKSNRYNSVLLKDKNKILNKVNIYLLNNCKHHWIKDTYDDDNNYYYCNICGVTKNLV